MSKQFYKEELGKMIAENGKLKKQVLDLTIENAELKDKLINYNHYTPTDGLEVGSPEDYGEQPWIYESPDNGKTVYKRRAGDYDNRQLTLFDKEVLDGK